MKIEYFQDTDTLLLEFSNSTIVDTKDLNENTLVEFDASGKLVSMTIEHAKEQMNVQEFIVHPSLSNQTLAVAEESAEYQTKKDDE
jgi:uncharacterized protein YuzE